MVNNKINEKLLFIEYKSLRSIKKMMWGINFGDENQLIELIWIKLWRIDSYWLLIFKIKRIIAGCGLKFPHS